MSRKGRLAYSTETGSNCKSCGRPSSSCKCGSKRTADEPVPESLVARLRVEKAGRKGKTVTVIDGLPANKPFLDGLAKELKTACGSGGTTGARHIEIQGDHRDELRSLLRNKGWMVKG